MQVIDARAPDRFRGQNETIDPVGGHIPGAVNRLFRDNLDAFGFYKPPAELRAAFEPLVGQHPLHEVVHQCGSGITAAPQPARHGDRRPEGHEALSGLVERVVRGSVAADRDLMAEAVPQGESP